MSFIRHAILALSVSTVAGAVSARDNVQIAGSSTVLPYASIVAEAFGDNTDFPTPVVESGGSSTGLKRFCEGVGANTIDIANASRRMKSSEVEACAANGVSEIIEIRIGYDGIVFASDKNGQHFEFTPKDWFLALAENIVVDGHAVKNPHTDWSHINASFKPQEILAMIPSAKHGTREVFEDKVLLAGCKEIGAYDVFLAANEGDKKAAQRDCVSVRKDGLSVDIDGDYTEILARLDANKNALGVFGLSFYENNTDKLQAAPISGVHASTQTIANGTYPVSRPLYFYIKKAHIGVIPGLKEYAQFFTSEDLAGPDGPLAEYGLVSDPELAETQAILDSESTL